ncbi:MAG: polysaccharide deacetylase family protein [Candidatus Omnitrophota bacterium]
MRNPFAIPIFAAAGFVFLFIDASPVNALEKEGIYSLVFHDVSPDNLDGCSVSPDYFRDVLQMIYLGGKKTIPVSEAVQRVRRGGPFPKELLLMTFDDGWAGNRDFAHPLLWQYGMKAAEFVHTNGTDQGRPRRCNWEDLRWMADSGVWEIHSHSASHPDLTALNAEALQWELLRPLDRLRYFGFLNEIYLAYPYGAYNEYVQQQAIVNGYAAGFTSGPAMQITRGSGLFAIPRNMICQLFDQNLVCRKIGLDLSRIRRNLSVFDEPEGRFDGHWTVVRYDSAPPGYTLGQYGITYASAQDNRASWSKIFSILTKGKFALSLWTPSLDASSLKGISWTISNRKQNVIANGFIQQRKTNGWTPLTFLTLEAGPYTLKIFNSSAEYGALIVDALKLERTN